MSKMKQHLEKQVFITGSRHEEMSWKRYIYFEYEGEGYSVLLFWDEFNGYELYWKNQESGLLNSRKAPEWVINWNEEAHNGMSFEHYLDELTWEMNK